MKHRAVGRQAVLILLMNLGMHAQAADLTVRVSGIATSVGQVGCALFKSPEGFPMNPAMASQQWTIAAANGVECRFSGVPSGEYALSVSHDFNGNKVIDTNIFGVPTEAWGVSNNVRPLMRAPKWHEALFRITEGKDMTLDVKLSK